MPKIQRPDGNIENNYTEYCPKCINHRIEKEISTQQVFDELGRWYTPIFFTCKNKECGYKWTEKLILSHTGSRL